MTVFRKSLLLVVLLTVLLYLTRGDIVSFGLSIFVGLIGAAVYAALRGDPRRSAHYDHREPWRNRR